MPPPQSFISPWDGADIERPSRAVPAPGRIRTPPVAVASADCDKELPPELILLGLMSSPPSRQRRKSPEPGSEPGAEPGEPDTEEPGGASQPPSDVYCNPWYDEASDEYAFWVQASAVKPRAASAVEDGWTESELMAVRILLNQIDGVAAAQSEQPDSPDSRTAGAPEVPFGLRARSRTVFAEPETPHTASPKAVAPPREPRETREPPAGPLPMHLPTHTVPRQRQRRSQADEAAFALAAALDEAESTGSPTAACRLSAAQPGAAQPGAAKHVAAKHGAQHGGALTPSHSGSNLTLKLPALATALPTSFADVNVNANYDSNAYHQPLRSRMLHPGGCGGAGGGSQMQIMKDCMSSLAGSAAHDGGGGAYDGARGCGGGGCGGGGGGSGTRSAPVTAPPTCSALKRASHRQRVSAPVEPAGADGSYEAVCEDLAPDPPNHFIAEARGAIAVARAAAAAAIQPKGSSYSLTLGCLAAPPARAPAFAPHGQARLAQAGELGSPSATAPVTAQVILTAGAFAATAGATAAGATAAAVAALAHPPLPHATGHLGPKMARGPVSRKPPREPWSLETARSLETAQQGAPRESPLERQMRPAAPPGAIEGRAHNLAPPRLPLQSPPQPPLQGHQPPPQTPVEAVEAAGFVTSFDGGRVGSSTSTAPTASTTRAAALATAGEIAGRSRGDRGGRRRGCHEHARRPNGRRTGAPATTQPERAASGASARGGDRARRAASGHRSCQLRTHAADPRDAARGGRRRQGSHRAAGSWSDACKQCFGAASGAYGRHQRATQPCGARLGEATLTSACCRRWLTSACCRRWRWPSPPDRLARDSRVTVSAWGAAALAEAPHTSAATRGPLSSLHLGPPRAQRSAALSLCIQKLNRNSNTPRRARPNVQVHASRGDRQTTRVTTYTGHSPHRARARGAG